MRGLTVLALGALAFSSACGGGSTSTSTSFEMQTRAPKTEPAGLADRTDASSYGVTIIGPNGSGDGTFNPSTQVALLGSTQFAAIEGAVNAGLSEARLLDGGAVAVTDATGALPTGRATFNGAGMLFVTDGPAGVSYEGSAQVTMSLRTDGSASGTLYYDDFVGVRLDGVESTVVSGGSLRISGIAAGVDGITGGNPISLTGFGTAELSDTYDYDLTGAFAGEGYTEAAGIVSISGTETGSAVQGTFAGVR